MAFIALHGSGRRGRRPCRSCSRAFACPTRARAGGLACDRAWTSRRQAPFAAAGLPTPPFVRDPPGRLPRPRLLPTLSRSCSSHSGMPLVVKPAEAARRSASAWRATPDDVPVALLERARDDSGRSSSGSWRAGRSPSRWSSSAASPWALPVVEATRGAATSTTSRPATRRGDRLRARRPTCPGRRREAQRSPSRRTSCSAAGRPRRPHARRRRERRLLEINTDARHDGDEPAAAGRGGRRHGLRRAGWPRRDGCAAGLADLTAGDAGERRVVLVSVACSPRGAPPARRRGG